MSDQQQKITALENRINEQDNTIRLLLEDARVSLGLEEIESRLEQGRTAADDAHRRRLNSQSAQLARHDNQLAQIMKHITSQDEQIQQQSNFIKAQQDQIDQQSGFINNLVHGMANIRANARLASDRLASDMNAHIVNLRHNCRAEVAQARLVGLQVNNVNNRITITEQRANQALMTAENMISMMRGMHNNAFPSAQLQAFHPFSKLPLEIRIRIWKMALPEPRVVEVGYYHVNIPGFYIANPPPRHGMFSACKESYQVYDEAHDYALSSYYPVHTDPYLTEASLQFSQEHDLPVRIGVRYQKDYDTILLRGDAPEALLSIFESRRNNFNLNIQKLAVEHMEDEDWNHEYLGNGDFMDHIRRDAKLEWVVLFFSESHRTGSGDALTTFEPFRKNTEEWRIEATKARFMSKEMFREFVTAPSPITWEFELQRVLKWSCGHCGTILYFNELRCLNKSAGYVDRCDVCDRYNKVTWNVVSRIQTALMRP